MYRCTEIESPLYILYHIESNITIFCAESNRICKYHIVTALLIQVDNDALNLFFSNYFFQYHHPCIKFYHFTYLYMLLHYRQW